MEIIEDGRVETGLRTCFVPLMRNLVKEFGVKSTRSKLYTKPVKFADYILVSNDVKVNKFDVINMEVSDHLPLFLDFD